MPERVSVPRLHRDFEEPTVEVAILEAFQKLGYDRPTQDQALAVRNFVLGYDVFVMLPTCMAFSSVRIVLALAVCFWACSSLTKHGCLQANVCSVPDVPNKGSKCAM